MKRARCAIPVAALLLASLWAVAAAGTQAELYFSADKNGETRVTQIQEGDQIWIVVNDPDEDIDCDVRDKVWTEVKVIDAKTGAHIVWKSYIDRNGADVNGDGVGEAEFGDIDYVPHKGHWPGVSAGWLGADYLEETGRSTGTFVSDRPFQIGTRVDFSRDGREQAHIVSPYSTRAGGWVEPTDFIWGGYLYADNTDAGDEGDDRVWVSAQPAPMPPAAAPAVPQFMDARVADQFVPGGVAYLPHGDAGAGADDYMLGRFENMDTIVGLYVDQNDPGDVALTLAKIIDTEAAIVWSREIYPDGNEAATITITDPDENLHDSKVEMVPVFVLVNPGSWNWDAEPTSATDFWALNRWGGVVDLAGTPAEQALLWCNVYDSGLTTADVNLRADGSRQPNVDGTYYVHYPREEDDLPVWFDTDSESGVTRVMFYATETSASSGIFELRLNSILEDLGFHDLNVRDVLVAYYIDPNDQDDFKLALAYIGEKEHSVLRFTDYARQTQDVFWLGRDPVYVEVVDANANVEACCPEKVVVQVCDPHEVDDTEWLILDELSSNSPVFFSSFGMQLVSVWEALGVGDPGMDGGYSLELDNWDLEAFNEDSIYVRYNDVVYAEDPQDDADTIDGLGDQDTMTSFPPAILRARVANDVSFAVFEVGDTQVVSEGAANMRFLDRQGNVVAGYANSDCVFVEVVDPDQNEDRQRRERIAGFWDGHQHIPFGPMALNYWECGQQGDASHIVNQLLGDTNIFDETPATDDYGWAKVYVLNPRSGRWAPIDLFETGTDTGEFISVTCVDLVSPYECVPSLGVLPGDTILAAYQDPSNHSDIAWISVKVSIGGSESVKRSSTQFVDAAGNPVSAYVEGDLVYVRVDDLTLAGAGTVAEALTVQGSKVSLSALSGEGEGAFITAGLDLATQANDTITATYVDPTDPTDTSTATIPVVAGVLRVDRFYTTPNPAAGAVTFGFVGQGLADSLTASVYDLRGHLVWTGQVADALSLTWDGLLENGREAGSGAYVYLVSAARGTDRFTGKGTLFILH